MKTGLSKTWCVVKNTIVELDSYEIREKNIHLESSNIKSIIVFFN